MEVGSITNKIAKLPTFFNCTLLLFEIEVKKLLGGDERR